MSEADFYIKGKIIAITDKAVLIQHKHEGIPEKYWFPRSCVNLHAGMYVKDAFIALDVPAWLWYGREVVDNEM